MSDNWWFIQSMKRKQRDRKLDEIRQEIKEALANEKLISEQLAKVPADKLKGHPLRIEWIAARSKYWDLIAKMRDIEHGKV
tara:strand:+ start:427 stop:669 length:243 start_codon:yes stop_codon:yes gene_type:complete